MTWKNQHPPSGRTGDSTPELFPLITLISMPLSGPLGKADGILDKHASDLNCNAFMFERTGLGQVLDNWVRPFYTIPYKRVRGGMHEVFNGSYLLREINPKL